MDIVVWILTGGAVGWASYTFLGFNAERSLAASIGIGAVGALIGGKMIAPMLGAVAAAPGDFSTFGLLLTAAVAAAFLALGSLVHARWGV